MRTISLKLPDELDAQLTALARDRQRSKSELIRDAILEYLARGDSPRVWSFFSAAEDLAGRLEGPVDLSINEAYLAGYGQ